VDVYVNYLRKKLGAARSELYGDMFGPDRVIETVRGEGYMMAAPAERLPVASVDAEAELREAATGGSWGTVNRASA